MSEELAQAYELVMSLTLGSETWSWVPDGGDTVGTAVQFSNGWIQACCRTHSTRA